MPPVKSPIKVSFKEVEDQLPRDQVVNFQCGMVVGEKLRDMLGDLPVNEDVMIYALRFLGACAIALDTPPYPTDQQRAEREIIFAQQASAMAREMHGALVKAFEIECPEEAKKEKEAAA